MNLRKTSYFSALLVAGALAVTSCGAAADSDPSPSLPPIPSPSETMIVDPVPTETQLNPTPLGQTATTESGLAVTVTPAGTGFDDYQMKPYTDYTITLTNNTAANYDPAMFMMNVNYGAAGLPASQVFDLGRVPTPYFKGVILPGGTQTITQSYDVPDGETTVISVTTTWEDGPLVFTG